MPALRCSSPCSSTAWMAASRAGRTRKALSQGVRQPIGHGVVRTGAAIVTYQWGVVRIAEYGPYGDGLDGWCVFSTPRPRLYDWPGSILDPRPRINITSRGCPAIGRRHRRGLDMAGERPDQGRAAGPDFGIPRHRFAGALMISRFAFNSFKQVTPGARVRFPHIVLVPLAFVLIFLHPSITLLALFGGYALSAPTVWVYRRLRRRTRGTPTHA